MIKACGICRQTYNEDLLETHHKVPRCLNGSDDPSNLIDICPVCHTSIHSLVRLLKKDPGLASAFLHDNYGSDAQIHELVIQLAKVIIYEEENGDEKDYVLVSMKVPRKIHKLLSDLSKGSRASMENYLLALIEREGRRSLERGQFNLRRKG